MENGSLAEFLPYRISALAGKLSRNLHSRYNAIQRLTVPEWRVLFHLEQADTVSVNQLVFKVDLHKSRVSRACNRLEKSGLITRRKNPDDRRQSHLALTREGKELMQRLKPIAMAFNSQLQELLGKDCASFVHNLNALLESEIK